MLVFSLESSQSESRPQKKVPYPVWEGSLLPVQIEPLNKQKKRVFLDDGTILHLYNGEIRRFQLSVDTVLEGTAYTELMQCLCKRARSRALHLLQAADRPTTEILEKLRQGGYPEAVAEDALAYLDYYGYTDDTRYIQNYIESHQKTQSRAQIRQTLCRKGLDSAQIDALLPEEHDAERELLMRLTEKYCRGRDLSDEKEYRRLVARLMRRGFGYVAIKDAIGCFAENIAEIEEL